MVNPEVKACPVCGKPMDVRYKPFCSKRCADIDLNRWLTGVYVVPGAAQALDDEDGAPDADDTTPGTTGRES
jgi:endogenous inhibitor of DNA gyrase (YacG/DUF329 family)